MTGPVLLNNVDHHDLRVKLGHGAAFGDAINQVELLPSEFEAAQREYPILLRRSSDAKWRSFALLGLDSGENLFLESGRWRARYVPALVQRGPFSIGVPAEGGEPMIHIDPAHPRVSREDGEPLFLEHGGNAPYLDHIARVLQVIYAGVDRAAITFDAFEQADLITPVTLEITLPQNRNYHVPDCYTINTDALAELDGAALAKLNRADALRAAIWLASSLGNVGRLIEWKTAADA